MRRLLMICAVFAVAVGIGCGPPPSDKHFQDVVMVHFSQLNIEGETARIDARVKKAAATAPAGGRQYSTYSWHPEGVILEDVECNKCRTRQTVVAYRGEDVPCSSCGSPDRDKTTGRMSSPLLRGGQTSQQLLDLYREKARPMFELRAELAKGTKEKVAIVRYVRQHWIIDDLGKIDISEKAMQRAGTTSKFDTEGGYHRPDSMFIGTTAFFYTGAAQQIDSASVAKILKGEADRKLWKLGSAMPIEQPVRPWDAPRNITTPGARGN